MQVTFLFGRNNLALTVFVPYDCQNSCPFCTTKKLYANVDDESVLYQVQHVFKDSTYPIKDVVFTGGEPMMNLALLKAFVDIVPKRCNVYINTCLMKRGLKEFSDYVNSEDKIKGINVSRHGETYEEDCRMLHDIALDDAMSLFAKPVRINCVVGSQDIDAVINRWKNKGVNLCFRKDYTIPQTQAELHDVYEPFMLDLINKGFKFDSHTQCNVCDTMRFVRDGFTVAYHKGLEHSSIMSGDVLEINDLIIFPDGRMSYDWDGGRVSVIAELETAYSRKSKSRSVRRKNESSGFSSCVCGGGGSCGWGCGFSHARNVCGGGGSLCGSGGC